MKYVVEIGSGVMIYIPGFINLVQVQAFVSQCE